MKTRLLAASLLLVGASAVSCSGGDDTRTYPSKDKFCDTLAGLSVELADTVGMTKEEGVAKVQAWAKKMDGVGTPEGIPAKARQGFELMIDEVSAFGDDTTTESLDSYEESLTDSEKAASKAFEKYSTNFCGEI